VRLRRLIPLLPVLATTACSLTTPVATPLPEPSRPAPRAGEDPGLFAPDDITAPETIGEGTFQPAGPTAVTYDPGLVPAGATALVTSFPVADGLAVRLSVTGLVPRHMYGAHLHTGPCTAQPDDAGPHYQHDPDPKASPADPAYANPHNEVWLDFTADADGRATVTAVRDRAFDLSAPPRSLIVHAERTRTAAGVAGTAGARVACLTVTPG
jgi:superoxide dismutase, Cu-Zn family